MPSKPAYQVLGDRVYSYQTCIRQTLPGGLTIGNVTHYSSTTTAHQNKAGCDKCDVLLGNVDRGVTDLLTLAIERGLVEPGYNKYRLSARADSWTHHPALVDNLPNIPGYTVPD